MSWHGRLLEKRMRGKSTRNPSVLVRPEKIKWKAGFRGWGVSLGAAPGAAPRFR